MIAAVVLMTGAITEKKGGEETKLSLDGFSILVGE